ncbi:MAG: MoaD/ThiS family protein [Bacteroidota bacterium]
MIIRLVAYGIARELIGARESSFEFDGSTIAELKSALTARHPAFANLRSLSFAIGEDYRPDDHPLHDLDEVVIIPPVSGG